MRDEDRCSLSALVHRYAEYADARDVEGAVGLFAEDVVLVVPEPPRTLGPAVERHGHEGVRETLAALAHAVRTVHEVTGETYDAGGAADSAHGSITGVAHHLLARGEELVDLTWGLRWDDVYRRTAHGWRIARRELTIAEVEVQR